MRPRLILHVGTHKTGTTSIQKALADNREWLFERGLIYPDGGPIYKGRFPHHKWAHSLTGAEGCEPQKAKAFIDYAASFSKPTILISAEPIYRHIDGYNSFDVFQRSDYWERRHRYIANCAAKLSRCDVRVVIWLRNTTDFARSLHAEMIAKGHWSGPFGRFLEVFAVWFDYDRQLEAIRGAFAHVDVFSYDEDRNNLIARFFERIGSDLPPGAETIWERHTLPEGR